MGARERVRAAAVALVLVLTAGALLGPWGLLVGIVAGIAWAWTRPLRVPFAALIAGGAVVLGVTTVLVDRDTGRAGHAEPGARLVATPYGRVQVRVDGRAGAPVLVLLHGWSCSLHWWDAVTPTLARRYRVVRLDLLGFGGSDKPDWGYGIPAQGRAVAAALARLGIRRATVVGHSMGAAIAVATAEAAPQVVQGLELLDMEPNEADQRDVPVVNTLATLPVAAQWLWRTVPDFGVRIGLQVAFAPGYDAGDFIDQGVRDYHRSTFQALERGAAETDDYIEVRPLDQRLRKLGLPTLIVVGGEDQFLDPGRVAADYRPVPRTRVAVVAGAGHSPMIEKPVQTARLIASAM